MLKHFTIILALHLAAGSQADAYEVGDVLYCSTVTGAYVESNETKAKLFNERFKFQIKQDNSGNKIMKFGEGGYFDNGTRNIRFLSGASDLLEAGDKISHFKLHDGEFHYGYAFYSGAGFMKGTCDKF